MKISFLDDEPEIFPNQYGGKARTILNLAQSFAKLPKVEKVSILSRTIGYSENEFEWNGVHFKKLSDYGIIRQIVDESDSTDVLNVHTCSFTFPYLENRKAILVNHLHDIIFATVDAGSHLDKAIGGKWDAIITPSDFAATTLKNATWWNNIYEKTHVLPRGIDKNKFFPAEKKRALEKIVSLGHPQITKKSPILFFPHRLDSGKGEYLLNQIEKILIKKYPNLLILTTASHKSSSKYIYNIGWIESDNLNAFYSVSDVIIATSLLPESFSQVCLEAIACNIPVVSFKFGNLFDLSNKVPAIKSCEPDADNIARTIEEILSQSDATANNLTISREIINSDYSLDIIAKQYLELYEAIIQQKKSDKGYRFVSNVDRQKKRYFSSPFLAIYGRKIYLSENKELQKFTLSEIEVDILKTCKTVKIIEEIVNSMNTSDSIIQKTIKKLVKNKLIIEG